MSRTALLDELDAYRPADQREQRMAKEIAAFVRDQARCFERDLSIGHVTASAWIIDAAGTHALLTHHRKLGRWLQLGGHADGDANVRRVALREATEESGLAGIRLAGSEIYDVDVHRIPARGEEPEHTHYDVRFLFVADRDATLVVSAESHELAWRPIDALDRDGIDESVRRLARKTPHIVP